MNARNDVIGAMEGGSALITGVDSIDQINGLRHVEGALRAVWNSVHLDLLSYGDIKEKEFDKLLSALQTASDELVALVQKYDPSQAIGSTNRAMYRRKLCSAESPCRHCQELLLQGEKVRVSGRGCPLEGYATVLPSGEIAEMSGRFGLITGIEGSSKQQKEGRIRTLLRAAKRNCPTQYCASSGRVVDSWDMHISEVKTDTGEVESYQMIAAPAFE